MKRSSFRFAWPLGMLLVVPFVYNSCQGGLLGAKGFGSNKSASCKVAMENGVLTKMELPGDRIPSPFENQKVKLKADLDKNSALAKASGPIPVDSGTSLSVILNNRCLQENRKGLTDFPISYRASESGLMIPELDRQAYEWVLDRSYTDQEIEEMAEVEPCVVGISWNREYALQATFNDPGLLSQLHYGVLRGETAYDKFYNDGGGMSLAGQNVVLAVVDTGVDWMHPDLQANMWAHRDGIGIDITTLDGIVDYNPFDVSSIGHGTHVAGLMAAVANNNRGVIGVMPYRAKIMAIKIFRQNTNGTISTTSQFFYNGVKFAYRNGADVINLSLGSLTNGAATDSTAESAIEEAIQNGSVVTTVIGNADGGQNGRLVDGTTFSSIPGQFSTRPGVIGVGSFDAVSGEKSSFSHYSTTFAEIGAPGAEQGTTGVYSTIPTSLSSYGRLAGTSQAAPMVSAAAGLTIGIIREAYGIRPTPGEVERLILKSAAKSPKLMSYFKDGNQLDLQNLIDQINTDYPLTKTGGSIDLSGGCVP